MGKTEEIFHALCPKDVHWKAGKVLSGRVNEDILSDWIDSLNMSRGKDDINKIKP